MHVTDEASPFARCNHRPVDVIDSRIALGCPENIARFRSTLGQPCHHIVAEGHFSCPFALGSDEPHDLTVEINLLPFQKGCLPKPRSSYKKKIGHRAESGFDMLEELRDLVGRQVVNHAICRFWHELHTRQRIVRYQLLFYRTIQHASQRADLDVNRSFRDGFPGAFLIEVLASTVYILSDMIWLELVNVLDGQPLKNRGQSQVCPEGVLLTAVSQKPLNVFVRELQEQRTSAVPVLDTEVKVELHFLFYLSALTLGLRPGGDTNLPPAMPESCVPNYLSVGSLPFPWHAAIQQ